MIRQWTDALKGIGRWLIPPLADFVVDEKRGPSERGLIASIYGEFAADMSNAYVRLEKQLTETSGPDATVDEKVDLAKKQARIGLALLVMGQEEKVWPLLKHSPDPTLRSYLIEWLAQGGVDPKVLIARLEEEHEVSVKQAILLSLGEYGLDRLPVAERQNQLPQLLHLYRDDLDSGVHGAAEWLLRQWQTSHEMKAIDKGLATGRVEGNRQWYVNRQGQTMVVVPKPGEFWMGEGKERHRKQIERSFAMASKEVTVDQFLLFRKEHNYDKKYSSSGDCPMNSVTWYEAAMYCNWLSEQEGIPKDQWCYEPNKDGKYEGGMMIAANFLQRTGYRLPTEAEWEYACRAGTGTGFSFGDPEELLSRYAWFVGNSLSKNHSVGLLRVNDLGLFDMHGNIWEWCQDAFGAYGDGLPKKDQEESLVVNDQDGRVFRGGSVHHLSTHVRSTTRDDWRPTTHDFVTGFRVARTLPPVPLTPSPPPTAGGSAP
jgi:formylglycine-generating enzyme required for sulfatase activity